MLKLLKCDILKEIHLLEYKGIKLLIYSVKNDLYKDFVCDCWKGYVDIDYESILPHHKYPVKYKITHLFDEYFEDYLNPTTNELAAFFLEFNL